MNPLTRLLNSSIGKKWLMALTGAVLVLFALGHMVGNLQIFLGSEVLNHYAKLLHASQELLWGVRLGLLGCAVIHIWMAIWLTIDNRRARPQKYEDKKPVDATLASRMMGVSGTIVLIFIVFHILHFTTRDVFPEFKEFKTMLDGDEVHDVYRMVIAGFSNVWVSLFYILGVGLLCMHLSHGIQSLFHTLGLVNKGYQPIIDWAGKILSIIIFVGMSIVPIAILLKIVTYPL